MWTILQRSSFWAGTSMIVAGIGSVIADGDIMAGIEAIITGIGLIGLWARSAPMAHNVHPSIKLTMKG